MGETTGGMVDRVLWDRRGWCDDTSGGVVMGDIGARRKGGRTRGWLRCMRGNRRGIGRGHGVLTGEVGKGKGTPKGIVPARLGKGIHGTCATSFYRIQGRESRSTVDRGDGSGGAGTTMGARSRADGGRR